MMAAYFLPVWSLLLLTPTWLCSFLPPRALAIAWNWSERDSVQSLWSGTNCVVEWPCLYHWPWHFLSFFFLTPQEPSNKRVKPLSRVTSLANLIPPVKATPLKRFSQTLQVRKPLPVCWNPAVPKKMIWERPWFHISFDSGELIRNCKTKSENLQC